MRLLLAAIAVLACVSRSLAQREPGEGESTSTRPTTNPASHWTNPTLELRGVWMSSKEMLLPRKQIIAKLDQLQAANFNTILIDAYFRGYVAWPGSTTLPQFPEFHGEDRLAFIIDEAHKRGLRAGLWMEYGFYAHFTPDAGKDKSMGRILVEHPDLLSIDAQGHKFIHRSFGDFYSLCPANSKSQDILAQIYVEALQKYPSADELNLDRIRFADANYCFCDYCRAHFKDDTGVELREFAKDSSEARRWLEWKRRQTRIAMQRITAAARHARPGMPITSYVVGPDEMDARAQSWDTWGDLLDGIAVSMYGADIRPAARRAIELLGKDSPKLICAISCEQNSGAYVANIELSREFTPLGQYTWHLGALEDDIGDLERGPYSKPAQGAFP